MIKKSDKSNNLSKKKNHVTSPKLYRSYYLHPLREAVSPVCSIFWFILEINEFSKGEIINLF